MGSVIIYLSAIIFLLCIFPVYVFNYVGIFGEQNKLEVTVSLYKVIPIFNLQKKIIKISDIKLFNGNKPKLTYPKHYLALYNKLCITKVIQVSDFGLQSQANAYLALTQNVSTQVAYSLIQNGGSKTKLRNYLLLNEAHGEVNYLLKVVGIVNLITLLKVVFIYLRSLINERKNKENAG